MTEVTSDQQEESGAPLARCAIESSNGHIPSPNGGQLDADQPTRSLSKDSSKRSSTSSDASDEKRDPNVPVPIDGGWGWFVVLGSFLIHVIADGIVYSFGIFYIEFLHHFGSSKGDTSWVASLIVGCTFITGKAI